MGEDFEMTGTVRSGSEVTLARSIFGPLGGIVEIGAIGSANSGLVCDASIDAFMAAHGSEVGRLVEVIQEIGEFHPETMDIVDELGWNQDHEIQVLTLFLWSGSIEAFSNEAFTEEVGGNNSVRRMIRMGGDLQATNLLHALVGAAASLDLPGTPKAGRIVEAVHISLRLLGSVQQMTAVEVFRMWRVAFLSHVLPPSSRSPEPIKKKFREYAHVLEERLTVV